MNFRLKLVFVLGCCAAASPVPTVEQYEALRGELEGHEAAMRFDSGNRTLTPQETAASMTLASLSAQLRLNMTNALGSPIRPLMPQIRGTRLFRILHEMPKASLLHIHDTSMNDIRWFVENATRRAGCYVSWNETGSAARKGTAGFFTPDTAPPGWTSAEDLRRTVPGFESQLTSLWDTMDPENRYDPSRDQWTRFNPYFNMTQRVFLYAPVYADYVRKGLRTATEAWKVHYIEVRGLGYGNVAYDLQRGEYTMRETRDLVAAAVREVVAEGQLVGARWIYSQFRRQPVHDIASGVAEAVALHNESGWLVSGYDLVGEEDAGYPLKDFIPALLDGARSGLPFFFHAGETTAFGTRSAADNVNDAVLLGSRRIGHGLALAKLPAAASKARCLEICPVSNQGLQYVLDTRDHPIASLLSAGVQFTISNDDPALFGTADSLAWDWWLALVGWPALDLASIKYIIRSAVVFSSASNSEKDAVFALFEREWDEWVGRIVAGEL